MCVLPHQLLQPIVWEFMPRDVGALLGVCPQPMKRAEATRLLRSRV